MSKNTPLDRNTLRTTLRVFRENKENYSATSAALGIARSSLKERLDKATELGVEFDDAMVEFPSFVTEGDEETPVEDILNRLRKDHLLKEKAAQQRMWFPLKIREDKPYGVMWFGDPHLGPHCNWKLLDRHLEIARMDGVYGANIGDTTDNWPWTGRLARLWAEANISSKEEKRLAQWFMFEAGVNWLVWLLGNHDEWNGTAEMYKKMGAFQVPMIDWRARFRLVHEKTEVRVDAAHGRKGSSIYNPTHGTLRDAKFGEQADLFVTGHTHNFGVFDIEFSEKRQRTWLAQVAGYKVNDHYALVNGYSQANCGSAVLAVVDPRSSRLQVFADVEEGADFLHWKRSR